MRWRNNSRGALRGRPDHDLGHSRFQDGDAVAGLAHRNVIRVMPNTPSRIGEGMSLWLASASVGEAHKEAARTILKTLGEEMEVSDEKYLDMGTALSAGGPAYVFLFLGEPHRRRRYMGMSRDMATEMALQTLLGKC